MPRLERGILKFKGKHQEYGEYLFIANGRGQFAFMGINKILKTHPENPQKWQDTLFMVKEDSKGLNWKDEKEGSFDLKEYQRETIPLPKPIPQEFLELYIDPNAPLVQEKQQVRTERSTNQEQPKAYVFIPKKNQRLEKPIKEETTSTFVPQGDGSTLLYLNSIRENVALIKQGMQFVAQYLKTIVELLSAQLNLFSKSKDLNVEALIEDLDDIPEL